MTETPPDRSQDGEPARTAARWLARLGSLPDVGMPFEAELPPDAPATLAALVGIALEQGQSLLIVVPDDDALPRISAALDLDIRPLCLVLPAADFAAETALRATLALLESRLWRDGDDKRGAAWSRQRERIAANPAPWKQAQAWLERDHPDLAPPDVAELFPARIMPLAACGKLRHGGADITVLFRCDVPAEILAPNSRLLQLGPRANPSPRQEIESDDASPRLLRERAQLGQDIADLELELASVQAELAEFTRAYYARVGDRLARHDALLAQQARREARRQPEDRPAQDAAAASERRAEQSARESSEAARAGEDAPAFRPRDAIKRQFRQLARQIHPDRAADEAERAWRTQLMSEANRAYRHGDERALDEIAALWHERRGAHTVGMTPAATLRLQVERMRARLTAIEAELHRLFGSRLYELFIAARQAGRQGRDLLGEMAAQLDNAIAALRQASSEC